MTYPLPYWWNFTVSGPVLPDFYWNVKSQEERIKKISEDLWKLIQLYKLIVEAINDHEDRIVLLEAKVIELELAITDLYEKYDALLVLIAALDARVAVTESDIVALDGQVAVIQGQIITIQGDITTIKGDITTINGHLGTLDGQIIAIQGDITTVEGDITTIQGDVSDKMNLVPLAIIDHVATYDIAGQVVDGGSTIAAIIAAGGGGVSPIIHLTGVTLDNIPTVPGTYFNDDGLWVVTYLGIDYGTSMITVTETVPPMTDQLEYQHGLFSGDFDIDIVHLARTGLAGYTFETVYYPAVWNAWVALSHEFIQSDLANAATVSAAKPTALVYIPEGV